MSLARKLVLGNWKMHGDRSSCQVLVEGIVAGVSEGVDVGLCVPFPYLSQVGALLAGSSVALGAQDVSAHASGAYTGEVSAGMLSDQGCRYVLVGHSERRMYHHESNAVVGAKMSAASKIGLLPVLCCGETFEQHQAGETESVVGRQLDEALQVAGLGDKVYVVAYEPVWAIGTGLVATPEHVEKVHAQIKRRVGSGVRVLYGGSVKPENAPELFDCPSVDGALVGGASLKSADFLAICCAAAQRAA